MSKDWKDKSLCLRQMNPRYNNTTLNRKENQNGAT
jgi:hypothetical protein